MKKIVLSIAAVLLVLMGAYFLLNHYFYESTLPLDTPQRMSLSGTYVCLPLTDPSVQSADCAVGIRTDEGVYYAIDLGLMSQSAPQLVEGDRIAASGVVTPIETLSTDFWEKYPVVGIFSVTDSLDVIPVPEVEEVTTPTLTNTRWVWQETTLLTGSTTKAKEDAFVLTFADDLSYQSTTDCNSLAGTYAIDGEVLSLAQPSMTKMFCSESIEMTYVRQLILANSYMINGKELRLQLDRDYGVMVFKTE